MNEHKQSRIFDFQHVAIFVLLSLLYVGSQFLRNSNGIIAPELSAELSLSPADLGILSGAFFLAFGLAQVPVGVLLDRVGTRAITPFLVILAIIGCILFYFGQSLWQMVTARVLMGFGCASLLMGAYVVYARWFPMDRFATVSSAHMGIGASGMLLATAPLAYAAGSIGWRPVFLVTALAMFVLAALAFTYVKDAPPGHDYHSRVQEPLGQIIRGVAQVVRHPSFRFIFALNTVFYSAVLTILGLWGRPYLTNVYGLDAMEAGNILLIMGAFQIASIFVFGPMDRIFNSRKKVILTGSTGVALGLWALTVLDHPPLWLVVVLFCWTAGFSGYGPMILAHCRSLFPDQLVGRSLSTLNVGNMAGVAMFQMATGFILTQFQLEGGVVSETGYRVMYGFLALALSAALLLFMRSEDTRPFSKQL